jgi:hypothetical protein
MSMANVVLTTCGETEAFVWRKWTVLAAFAVTMTACAWAQAQDQNQPSLGDVARQNRKDKEKSGSTTPKTVVTDDTLSTGHDLGGLGVSDLGEPEADGKPGSLESGLAGLSRAETALNKLEPLDRASLARLVLDGSTEDFPNRAAWETKLFAAKQVYVSHSRELIQQMRQLLSAAQALKAEQAQQGKVNSDDPRVQAVIRKSQILTQEAVRTESAFQAVIMEGQDLAKQANKR